MKAVSSLISMAVEELLDLTPVRHGQILIVGCSTSEITGERIGKSPNEGVAVEVVKGVYDVLPKYKIALAAQCCEHLNRALVVEREVMEINRLEEVFVRPVMHAGGAFATKVWSMMKNPVAVEHIRGHFGLDIGDTLIGMHIKHVVVPIRLKVNKIGKANITAARYRPKSIGGSRAVYTVDLGK